MKVLGRVTKRHMLHHCCALCTQHTAATDISFRILRTILVVPTRGRGFHNSTYRPVLVNITRSPIERYSSNRSTGLSTIYGPAPCVLRRCHCKNDPTLIQVASVATWPRNVRPAAKEVSPHCETGCKEATHEPRYSKRRQESPAHIKHQAQLIQWEHGGCQIFLPKL